MREKNKVVVSSRSSQSETFQTEALIVTDDDCKMSPNQDAIADENIVRKLRDISFNYRKN